MVSQSPPTVTGKLSHLHRILPRNWRNDDSWIHTHLHLTSLKHLHGVDLAAFAVALLPWRRSR